MSFLKKLFAFLGANKKRDDEWAARFDNPPANPKGKLPLDPGRSDFS